MHNAYDQIAGQWHAREQEQGYVKRVLGYVERTLEGVPAGSSILDLGCGTGSPIGAYIARRGFRLTGVDASKKMLEIARREVPEAHFIHADMVTVQLPRKFAAAVAWDSVFHVERRHHASIYRKLADSLEVGGRLLLSVGGSDVDADAEGNSTSGGDPAGHEGFTSEMFGRTFFYSGYAPPVARRLLEAAGFAVEVWEVDDPTSRGHIAVIARKVE